MLGWLAVSAAAAIGCVWMALRAAPWSEEQIAGYLGAPISALMTVGFLVEAFRTGTVVEVTTFGIRDRRRSPDLIAWTGISEISALGGYPNPCVTLRLSPEARGKLRPSTTARYAAKMHDLGFPDLSISMGGLNGSLADLVKAINRVHSVNMDDL